MERTQYAYMIVFRNDAGGSWSTGNTNSNVIRHQQLLDDTVFDGIRDTLEYVKTIEKLKTYANKWQVE